MNGRHTTLARTLAALDHALTFMRSLWRLEHSLQRASKRMEGLHGITGPQRLALRVIGAHPDIGPAELAVALHLHPSTITGVIQRLEARRLIRRIQHADDGRRVRLRVTPAAARLNAPTAPGTVEQAVRSALRQVSTRERQATMAVLDCLATELMRISEMGGRPRRARAAKKGPRKPPHEGRSGHVRRAHASAVSKVR